MSKLRPISGFLVTLVALAMVAAPSFAAASRFWSAVLIETWFSASFRTAAAMGNARFASTTASDSSASARRSVFSAVFAAIFASGSNARSPPPDNSSIARRSTRFRST